MIAVILCGGSGTRLWPISRKSYPKQFLKLYGKSYLLQDTYLRTSNVVENNKIFIVGNESNYFHIIHQLKEINKDFDESNVFVEPMSLNTAPGIAFAIKTLIDKFNIDKNENIVILPSDQYIANVDEYIKELNIIKNFSSNLIITMGIKPDKPETGYGYIKIGDKIGDFYKVAEFKEKPDLDTAKQYLESNEYLWNSGIYSFSANTFIAECKKYYQEIYDIMQKSYDQFLNDFKTLHSISIDYAISEKTDMIIVLKSYLTWNDVGSFDKLADLQNEDNKKYINIDSKNVFSYSNSNRLIVALGIDDINIIDDKDAILIQKKGKSEDIKKVVDYLKQNNFKEFDENIVIHSQWGVCETLLDNKNCNIKILNIYLNQEIKLIESVHLIVVDGVAEVNENNIKTVLKKNEDIYLNNLNDCSIKNISDVDLKIIEVNIK